MCLVMATQNYGDINLALLVKLCLINHNIRTRCYINLYMCTRSRNMRYKNKDIHCSLKRKSILTFLVKGSRANLSFMLQITLEYFKRLHFALLRSLRYLNSKTENALRCRLNFHGCSSLIVFKQKVVHLANPFKTHKTIYVKESNR